MIQKLSIFALLVGWIVIANSQPYTIVVNQNVKNTLREYVQLKEPFIVGGEIHCALKCSKETNCRLFSLNVTNYCTLIKQEITLFDLVPEYKTSVYSKNPLKYCLDSDNYYPDMTDKVCKDKNLHDIANTIDSSFTTTESTTESQSPQMLPTAGSNYTAGLTNYWPISGSTIDVIDRKDMTRVENCSLTLNRFEKPNSAILFDSKGCYATIPSGIYFDPETNGFTIMVWVKLLSLNNWYQAIIDIGLGKKKDNILLGFKPGRQLYFSIFDDDKSRQKPSSVQIALQEWTNVALTMIGDEAKLYINGQLSVSHTGISYRKIERTSNFIGNNNKDEEIRAVMDDLKIFNRGLDQSEIQSEMNK